MDLHRCYGYMGVRVCVFYKTMHSHQCLQSNSAGFFLTSPPSMFLNFFSRKPPAPSLLIFSVSLLSVGLLYAADHTASGPLSTTRPPRPCLCHSPHALCTRSPHGHSSPWGRKGEGRRSRFGQNAHGTARKLLGHRLRGQGWRAGHRAERDLRAQQEQQGWGQRPGSGLGALHRRLLPCSYS